MRALGLAQLGETLRPKDGDERVAGQDAHQHKDDDGDADNGASSEQKTTQNVAEHLFCRSLRRDASGSGLQRRGKRLCPACHLRHRSTHASNRPSGGGCCFYIAPRTPVACMRMRSLAPTISACWAIAASERSQSGRCSARKWPNSSTPRTSMALST